MIGKTTLKIGALAEQAGTSAPTIRYYEEIGLLPRATRQAGRQRRYTDGDVRRLTFIRRCRAFDFTVEQVRTLVGLLDDRTRWCAEARDVGQAHLDALRAKMTELQQLERAMSEFVRCCDEECDGGRANACVPLVRLATVEAR